MRGVHCLIWTLRTVRHLAGSGRHQRLATLSAEVAEALRSGHGAGEARSYCIVPSRSGGDVTSPQPVFHPSNG